MNRSEFEEYALALVARGFSPLPIMPASKSPGMRSHDGSWSPMSNWTRWCREQPTHYRIAAWARMIGPAQDAGIGVACGRGLVCVDVDQEYVLDPILTLLPASPVQKKGRKGIAVFYRGDTDKIRSRNYRTEEKVGLIDLLADGKQTVLPPSVHPDTGREYFWWTDLTLADVRLEDLPEIPDDIAEQIGQVLKEFGYDPDRDRAEISARNNGARFSPRSEADNVYRTINDLALANLQAWVPHLKMRRCYRAGNGFKAVCEWRSSSSGRAFTLRAPNLSFTSRGIRDFGEGRGYSPLDVVMEALRIDLHEAFQWLGEWLGYDFGETIKIVNGPITLARLAAREAARKVIA